MSASKYSLAEAAKALNRPAAALSGLQARFGLPSFDGAGYSEAHLACLRAVVHLRTLGISEDRLLRLWHLARVHFGLH